METKIGQLFYEIAAKFDNNFSTNIKKAETGVKDLGKQVVDTEKKTASFSDQMKKLATGLGLIALGKIILDFGKASVQAFSAAQQSMIQFNNAQQNVAGTTKEQIKDLNEYILALEKKTSIDDKTIRQAAQIYAQDQLSVELQKKLLAGTVDLAVANSKAAGGGEIDVSGTAKALGLAISTGDLGRLTKQNIAGITETQKALFKVGTDAERTAILMKVLDENAKGAGEALGNSFQGKVNKAKDLLEDLQVAVGGGLTLGFTNLVDQLHLTGDGMEVTETLSRKIGKGFIYVTSIIAFMVNSFKLIWKTLVLTGTAFGGLIGVIFGWGKDVIGIFSKVGAAISSIGEAMGDVLTGNFKGAREALKKGFDFSGVFDNTKLALDTLTIATKDAAKDVADTAKDLAGNLKTASNAGEVYDGLKADQDKLTEAKTNAAKASERVKEATDEEKKATEDAKKKLEDFTKTLVEATLASQKASKELKDNLAKSFSEFGKSVSDSLATTKEKLAEIVVDAEQKKKELLAKSDRTAEDEAELKKVQATLDARVGYEARAAKQIEDIKKRLSDAGLDPNALQITSGKTLDEQIADARVNASLDAFSLFEKQESEKLTILANNFITEALLIQNKITAQKNLEADLTEFLKSENATRTADIEAFADTTIAKYGEIASSLRSVISLQNQVGAIKSSPTTGSALPKFSEGGFVDARGGEVHAGEFVVPASLVASNPDLMAMLDKARTQNNNITINTNELGGNVRTATEEMLWRLGKLN